MASKVISVVVGILALFALTGIDAQEGVPCHASFFQFTSRHSLNISQYVGDWYMHEIAGSDIGNFPAPEYKCSSRNLRIPLGNDSLSLQAVDSLFDLNDNITIAQTKEITLNATRSPLNSIWEMTEPTQDGDLTSIVIILAADLEFSEWTVVYSCSILPPNDYRYEVVMAMTRDRVITPQLRRYLKALMVGVGFRIGDHHPVDQTNCQ